MRAMKPTDNIPPTSRYLYYFSTILGNAPQIWIKWDFLFFLHLENTHTHTHTHTDIYIYIYIYNFNCLNQWCIFKAWILPWYRIIFNLSSIRNYERLTTFKRVWSFFRPFLRFPLWFFTIWWFFILYNLHLPKITPRLLVMSTIRRIPIRFIYVNFDSNHWNISFPRP